MKIQIETIKKEKLIQIEGLIGQNKVRQAYAIRYFLYVGIAVLVLIVVLLYNNCSIKKQKDIEVNQKNASLNQLLREKEWLISEINHRVKNNLQIVTGLLQRQSSFIDNAEALNAIQNSEHRMQSIALIHQRLYQSEGGLTLIDMRGYIEELIGYLTGCFDTANRLDFQREVEDIRLDVNQAVPFGLILNEAITNSIKYAFPDSGRGLIKIILRQTKEYEYLLVIADNGVGLPVNFNIDANNSMGITLIKGLCRQLNGTLEIQNHDGLTLKIAFKTDEILAPNFSKIE
ncbi:MAG TPA: sensor histidine kinase [Mucilaginibacter sp.]|nr:sensor histidine kinase [Mucilaginibacter sp.]